MKYEDIYTAVQAYLDNKVVKQKTTNNVEKKTHIQELVGKRISLNNIKIVGEK